jgi:hypothetical protein
MVQHVVGMLLALIELLEAEAERLNANVRRLVVEGAVALIAASAAGGLLVLGSVFVLWAFFAALRPALGEAWAALIVGVVVWTVVGGATWLVSERMRRRRKHA